jgi:hypothetical protein
MTVDDCLNATIMIPAGVVLATPIGEPLAMATRPVQEIESQRGVNPSTTVEHSIIISTVDNHLSMTAATDAVAVAVVVESSQEQQTLPSQYRVWWRRRIRRWLRQHEEAITNNATLCLTWISKFYPIFFIFGSVLFVILGVYVFQIFNPVIGVIVLVSVHFMMFCAFCAFGVEVSGVAVVMAGEEDAVVDAAEVVTDEMYWFLMYTMQVLRSFRMYYKSLVGCKINIINTCLQKSVLSNVLLERTPLHFHCILFRGTYIISTKYVPPVMYTSIDIAILVNILLLLS